MKAKITDCSKVEIYEIEYNDVLYRVDNYKVQECHGGGVWKSTDCEVTIQELKGAIEKYKKEQLKTYVVSMFDNKEDKLNTETIEAKDKFEAIAKYWELEKLLNKNKLKEWIEETKKYYIKVDNLINSYMVDGIYFAITEIKFLALVLKSII